MGEPQGDRAAGELAADHGGGDDDIERIAIAQRGQMFGELGLLGLTETGRRMRTAVSITECELLRMTKETFQVLILAQISCKSLIGSSLSVLSSG